MKRKKKRRLSKRQQTLLGIGVSAILGTTLLAATGYDYWQQSGINEDIPASMTTLWFLSAGAVWIVFEIVAIAYKWSVTIRKKYSSHRKERS